MRDREENVYKVPQLCLNEIDYSELTGVDGRISLNVSFKKMYRRMGIRFVWLSKGVT
jgi:hypothetical protein